MALVALSQIDAFQIAPYIWVGPAPRERALPFDVVVVSSVEDQPPLGSYAPSLLRRALLVDADLEEHDKMIVRRIGAEVAKDLKAQLHCFIFSRRGLNRAALLAAYALCKNRDRSPSEAVHCVRAHLGIHALTNESFLNFLHTEF